MAPGAFFEAAFSPVSVGGFFVGLLVAFWAAHVIKKAAQSESRDRLLNTPFVR